MIEKLIIIQRKIRLYIEASIAATKKMTKKKKASCAEKGFIQLTLQHCYSSLKEVRIGTLIRPEPGGKS